MKRFQFALAALSVFLFFSCDATAPVTPNIPNPPIPESRIIDHGRTSMTGITPERIARAKQKLVVAYWHSSHGEQIRCGIQGLSLSMDAFYGGNGLYILDKTNGLIMNDAGTDVNQFDSNLDVSIVKFNESVRAYLAINPNTNVVMAFLSGSISSATEGNIISYLDCMASLETEYPQIVFVYMTSYPQGTSQTENLYLRVQQIRSYCITNTKWLYDFYDIDCYDPDGNYYGDKKVTDYGRYDSDGNGSAGKNWALDWQTANPGKWWDCEAAHANPIHGNQKARAAWQLWCAIADGM